MFIWIVIAVVSGIVNIVNKMINLEAKKRLGITTGTLLNYFEATILSLLLVGIFYKKAHLGNLQYLKDIPIIYLMGGVLGLISMVLVMIGMSHVMVVYSAIFIILGQLASGFLVDTIVTGTFEWLKILGIGFILLGIWYNQRIDSMKSKNQPVA
jgi:uncharacterized membrane protein YdcZ (DUF606 family)